MVAETPISNITGNDLSSTPMNSKQLTMWKFVRAGKQNLTFTVGIHRANYSPLAAIRALMRTSTWDMDNWESCPYFALVWLTGNYIAMQTKSYTWKKQTHTVA